MTRFHAIILVLFFSLPIFAQSSNEPLFDELISKFRTKELSVGVLLQVVGDVQTERTSGGTNGFSIANARVSVSGELDGGFGYLLKTSFTRSPAILDVKLFYRFTPLLTLDLGLFKSPFSREYLTSASSIDFVNRSQIVTALAPGRQIGLQVSGTSENRIISYHVGLFNGNGYGGNGNDNNRFLSVGRVTFSPLFAQRHGTRDRLDLGGNVAYSDDERVTIGGGLLSNFRGKRFVYGGDARWTTGRWLFNGEVINADLEFFPSTTRSITGFHATAGYMITEKSQALLRWDSIRAR